MAGSPNPVETRSHTVNGAVRTEQRVLTPKVLQTARSHYNCPQTANQLAAGGSPFNCEGDAHERCMDGVPIENNGGDGTAASHWEKREDTPFFQPEHFELVRNKDGSSHCPHLLPDRSCCNVAGVLNGEVMVGTVQSTQISAISDITLAIFEDAGWYVADYAVVGPRCFYDPSWCTSPDDSIIESVPREPLLWGQGRGCSFVSGRCNQRAWQADGYFCDTLPDADGALGEGCTLGRRALGFCTLTDTGSEIPAQYQYFPDARLGGKVTRGCHWPLTTLRALPALHLSISARSALSARHTRQLPLKCSRLSHQMQPASKKTSSSRFRIGHGGLLPAMAGLQRMGLPICACRPGARQGDRGGCRREG